ncbi:PH domain-containing protein [Nocardia sp. NBC_00881]|uniref:PH domain-containing protein n=1 Tax=Nocardia sp. NBC_00881 TaxID=2975995 RepID=UPI003869C049|nr:PH domain-containing protein [Nocardia sp. NBC_00881]
MGAETGSAPTTRVIRIPRLAFLGVFILLMCVFFPFVGWPAGLWWLLLIPVIVLVWVLRTQTSISDAGLDLRTLSGSRHLDWAQVKGVRIPKRGYVLADLTDGTEVKLPAVSFDRLRDLVAASNGRIPNPFAGPEETEEPEEAGSTVEPAAEEVAESAATTAVVAEDEPRTNGVAKTSETENADTTGGDKHP